MLLKPLSRCGVFWGVLVAGSVGAQSPAPADKPLAAPVAVPAKAPTATPPSAAPPAPGALKPMKEVLQGAKALPGLLALHQKDDKLWIEIRPEQFNQWMFFSYNMPRSLGERGLYASQMGGSHVVMFRKVNQQVQLIAKNTDFFAKSGTPQAQFVAESFSDSLLASAPVVSAPDPQSQSVLIEAQPLLISDVAGYQTRLEASFRLPYSLDTRNSSFVAIHNTAQLTGLEVQAHFSVPKLPAPPMTPSAIPSPPPPSVTPDARSLFVNFYYSFTPLPEPMQPRVADERVGYFTKSQADYTDDTSIKIRRHVIKRWRLEKQDPLAAMSPPKAPVVYWLDKNIPEKYRQSVQDGVLEWNKAFEKIGFQGALQVKQQTASDDFNTADARHASIRWFSGADVGFAIGPSQADPRTGEILDADIGMSDVFARGARRTVIEDMSRPAQAAVHQHGADAAHCDYAQASLHEFHFAMDWLESQGLTMDSPQAEQLAQQYVKDVIMHEVGHTLGLRHNFRGSTVYSLSQMQDPRFTSLNGVSSSVMDYLPFNISPANENQGDYVMRSLGAYDYWAIAYGYTPFEPAQEAAGLAQLLTQSTRPELAFATDEDAGYGAIAEGIDPEVNRFDLGSDPLAYYKRRMTLSRQLWDRLQSMRLSDGESYERLTRSFNSAFRGLAQVGPLAAKYIGGVSTRRDRAGTGRPLFEAVPAARQREALQLITQEFFRAESFRFDPALLARLAPDHFDRKPNPEVSVVANVLALQRSILDPLFAPGVSARLLEAPLKASKGVSPLSLTQVHDSLQQAIWSEAFSGQEASLLRRNLQREHLRRVTDVLVKPSGNMPADARSLLRLNAQTLASQLQKSLTRGALSKETQAHFAESLNTLQTALQAQVQRSGL